MLTKTKIALTAALLAVSASGAFAHGTGVPGERNPNAIFGPGAQSVWYEGGRDMRQAKAANGQARSVYEGRAQAHQGRNAYEGRAAVPRPRYEAPVYDSQPWGPISNPSTAGNAF